MVKRGFCAAAGSPVRGVRGRQQGVAPPVCQGAEEDEDGGWVTDEEELVHVCLSGTFAEDELSRQAGRREPRLLGLDTEEPIVQIGGQIFVGKHGHAAGTFVFLKVSEPTDANTDPVFKKRAGQAVEYSHKTQRKLSLRRVFLKRRRQGEENKEEPHASNVVPGDQGGQERPQ